MNTTSERTKYSVLLGFALLTVAIGAILTPSLEAFLSGYSQVLTHPSQPDFDSFYWAGNLGIPFINSGIMGIIALLIFKAIKAPLEGVQIASFMLFMGFSFYGKNPLNMCFPALGVVIYTVMRKQKLREVAAVICFSGALSPIFSVTAFGTTVLQPGSVLAIAVGICLGLFAGFLMAMFSQFLVTIHQGRVLFNAAFAAGLSGTLIYGIQEGFGLHHGRYPYESTNYIMDRSWLFFGLLSILFVYLIITGIVMGGGKREMKLLWHRCFGGNFVQEFGFAASLINMGLMGFLCCAYVFLTRTGQLNGPIFACIFTAVGFAAAGVTFRVYLPTLCGVYVTAFLTGGFSAMVNGGAFMQGAFAYVGSRSMLLAAIYTCGIAPIVGKYGVLAGFFAGSMHSIIVPHIGALHGWQSLYNNGFSLCIVTVFLLPVYARLHTKRFAVDDPLVGSKGKFALIEPLANGDIIQREEPVMAKSLICTEREGVFTLGGHLAFGPSSVTLPAELGRAKYIVNVQEGNICLRHMTKGFDCMTSPIDGQPSEYHMMEGNRYTIELVVKHQYGMPDTVYVTNEKYRKPARFSFTAEFIDG